MASDTGTVWKKFDFDSTGLLEIILTVVHCWYFVLHGRINIKLLQLKVLELILTKTLVIGEYYINTN